jgi:hypothetical protein
MSFQPVAGEFQLYEEQKYGLLFVAQESGHYIPLVALSFCTAVMLQRETGGNFWRF